MRIQTEIFRAYWCIKHQLDHLEGLLQLDGVEIVVKVKITAGVDEIERCLIVQKCPIETRLEEILFLPFVIP